MERMTKVARRVVLRFTPPVARQCEEDDSIMGAKKPVFVQRRRHLARAVARAARVSMAYAVVILLVIFFLEAAGVPTKPPKLPHAARQHAKELRGDFMSINGHPLMHAEEQGRRHVERAVLDTTLWLKTRLQTLANTSLLYSITVMTKTQTVNMFVSNMLKCRIKAYSLLFFSCLFHSHSHKNPRLEVLAKASCLKFPRGDERTRRRYHERGNATLFYFDRQNWKLRCFGTLFFVFIYLDSKLALV